MSASRYPFPAVPTAGSASAASDEVGLGEVKPLHYLGRDLVAFRGEDGAVRIFDAHCPHLGAHLGRRRPGVRRRHRLPVPWLALRR